MIFVVTPSSEKFPIDPDILKKNLAILDGHVEQVTVYVSQDTDLYPLVSEFPTVQFETTALSHLQSIYHDAILERSNQNLQPNDVFMFLHPNIELSYFDGTLIHQSLNDPSVCGLVGDCSFSEPSIQNVVTDAFYRNGYYYAKSPSIAGTDQTANGKNSGSAKNGQGSSPHGPASLKHDSALAAAVTSVDGFNDFCFLVRGTSFVKHGGFDPRFKTIQGAALDFCYRAILAGDTILHGPFWKASTWRDLCLSYFFSKDLLDQDMLVSRYIFIWKYLGNPFSTLSHMVWILTMGITFRVRHTRAMLKAVSSNWLS